MQYRYPDRPDTVLHIASSPTQFKSENDPYSGLRAQMDCLIDNSLKRDVLMEYNFFFYSEGVFWMICLKEKTYYSITIGNTENRSTLAMKLPMGTAYLDDAFQVTPSSEIRYDDSVYNPLLFYFARYSTNCHIDFECSSYSQVLGSDGTYHSPLPGYIRMNLLFLTLRYGKLTLSL